MDSLSLLFKMKKTCHADLFRGMLLCLTLALLPASGQGELGKTRFNGIPLQDGDIFLTRSQTILSSLYANHGTTPGNYSHSAIFFHDLQGQPKVMHVQFNPCTINLEPFTRTYRGIALLRARLTTQQQHRLTGTLRTWAANPVIQRARFDHTMQDIPGRREQFYCVGLINEIWRSSELPPPFVNHQQPVQTTILKVLETDLGFDISKIISANTILQNPEFSLLTEWQNPKYTENGKFILDQVSVAIASYVEQGYSGRQPGWLAGLVRRFAAGLKGYNSEADRSMYLLALTRAYYRKICHQYDYLQRHGKAPELCSDEAVVLIRKLCDHYRDDFFTRICQVSQDGAVLSLAATDK